MLKVRTTVAPVRTSIRPLVTALTSIAVLAGVVTMTVTGPVGSEAANNNAWLSRRVLAIAHAGGEDEAPNETMFAYKRAAALGVDMLEMDVQLSGDGVLVVHHDATVNATTNATGRLDEMTYDQLFALDNAYRFTPQRSTCSDCPVEDYIYRGVRTGDQSPPSGYVADDFTIPSLEKIFQQFPDKLLDVEIKLSGEPARAAARELARLIDVYHRSDRTIVVSFDDAIVDYFASLAPDVSTSPGTDGVTTFFLDRKPQPNHQVLQVPPEYELNGTLVKVVSKQFVDDAHAAGFAVWVWMSSHDQENAEFYGELIDMGVDGLIAAAPQVARDTIDARGLAWLGDDATIATTTAPASTPPVSTGPVGPAPGARPVTAGPTYTG